MSDDRTDIIRQRLQALADRGQVAALSLLRGDADLLVDRVRAAADRGNVTAKAALRDL